MFDGLPYSLGYVVRWCQAWDEAVDAYMQCLRSSWSRNVALFPRTVSFIFEYGLAVSFIVSCLMSVFLTSVSLNLTIDAVACRYGCRGRWEQSYTYLPYIYLTVRPEIKTGVEVTDYRRVQQLLLEHYEFSLCSSFLWLYARLSQNAVRDHFQETNATMLNKSVSRAKVTPTNIIAILTSSV